MQIGLQSILSDKNVDVNQSVSQRQFAIIIRSVSENTDQLTGLNLGIVLDHSASMQGSPLIKVKYAVLQLIEQLSSCDRFSLIAFDHRAKVLISQESVANLDRIKTALTHLEAEGGTCLDEGLHLGLTELTKGQTDAGYGTISQLLIFTDGENEHGNNARCLRLAQFAIDQNITLNAFGFGDHWNQDLLEQLVDRSGGMLAYIPQPDAVVPTFNRFFQRVQTVCLTNAYLYLALHPNVHLAAYKPLAQVSPETIELDHQIEDNWIKVRLGDLITHTPRVIITNLYLDNIVKGPQRIANVHVRYCLPIQNCEDNNDVYSSEPLAIEVTGVVDHTFSLTPDIQPYLWALAKYRQTQIAEAKLQAGDSFGAAALLQSAANTALQMGDIVGATVLQDGATRLQLGEDLSAGDRKMTRLAAKTQIQVQDARLDENSYNKPSQ